MQNLVLFLIREKCFLLTLSFFANNVKLTSTSAFNTFKVHNDKVNVDAEEYTECNIENKVDKEVRVVCHDYIVF